MDWNNIVSDISKKYDNFYLYSEKGIFSQIENLKNSFPSVKFLYSVKCNSNEHILKSIFNSGIGADAASLGEVLLAEKHGLKKEEIFYSAPGKTTEDIENSIDNAILIADSFNEIKKIEAIAEKKDYIIKIGVRINPSFSFNGEVGSSSKFGIDEEQIYEYLQKYKTSKISICGIHVHLRSQELEASLLEKYYNNIMKMAKKLSTFNNVNLEYINMGSGIGIPYSKSDKSLDIKYLGERTEKAIKNFKKDYPNIKFIIETGRYLVGNNGVYVTKVLDKKISYGKTYIIVKNTLNGFFRPSIAKLVSSYTKDEEPVAKEPLFTKIDAFEIFTLKNSNLCEKVTIVGNLCTATDVIAEDVILPQLEYDDILIISNAGAYASVLSPMQFSSQKKPLEIFWCQNGKILI